MRKSGAEADFCDKLEIQEEISAKDGNMTRRTQDNTMVMMDPQYDNSGDTQIFNPAFSHLTEQEKLQLMSEAQRYKSMG
jgi:exopolysaccharide biosynthesis predicted pyruvyltransferase EpsI